MLVAILFIAATLIVGYDIATKTSFPGSKTYMEESIVPEKEDTTQVKEEEVGEEAR